MALPVTLIGGYLGAGKTTLVNRMLRQAGGRRIAVLVNEFGSLPIDEDLIEAQDGVLMSIAGGCICCAFGDDLISSLQQMTALHPPPDHIVIETSGVAIPAAIGRTLELFADVRLAGIIVLADALNLIAQLEDEYIGDTVAQQLCDADMLLLTKVDLTSETLLSDARERLSTESDAPVLSITEGTVSNALLLGDFATGLRASRVGHGDADYASVALAPEGQYDLDGLTAGLTDLSLGVLRCKGYVQDAAGELRLLQTVGTRSEISRPAQPQAAGLVFIGLKERFDTARIEALLAECRR